MNKRFTALIVDDEQGSVEALKWALKDEYNIIAFNHPKLALRMLEKNPQKVDLIFLDMLMDGMNGIELLGSVKKVSEHIEVIIVSACRNKDLVLTAMRKGAFDCVEKPFSVAELKGIAEKARQKRIVNLYSEKISEIVEEAVYKPDEGGTESLISEIYAHDRCTLDHSKRVSVIFSRMAALFLGITDDVAIRKARISAFFHDIGKIWINEDIINKKGPLTKKEYEEVKKHPVTGYNVLNRVNSLKKCDIDLVLHHQERIDGRGYPDGLKGGEISLCSRILSIIDAYDAMTDCRPYRKRFSVDIAVNELKKNAGTQFDAGLVGFFLENMDNLL